MAIPFWLLPLAIGGAKAAATGLSQAFSPERKRLKSRREEIDSQLRSGDVMTEEEETVLTESYMTPAQQAATRMAQERSAQMAATGQTSGAALERTARAAAEMEARAGERARLGLMREQERARRELESERDAIEDALARRRQATTRGVVEGVVGGAQAGGQLALQQAQIREMQRAAAAPAPVLESETLNTFVAEAVPGADEEIVSIISSRLEGLTKEQATALLNRYSSDLEGLRVDYPELTEALDQFKENYNVE